MSLTDVSFLRDDLDFSERNPTTTFLENRQVEAETELREWITDEAYAAAVTTLDPAQTPDPDTTELRKAKIFRQVESRLVLFFALPSLNIKVSDHGIVLAAVGGQGDGNLRTATPKEVREMKQGLWKDAWTLASKFIPRTNVLPVVK